MHYMGACRSGKIIKRWRRVRESELIIDEILTHKLTAQRVCSNRRHDRCRKTITPMKPAIEYFLSNALPLHDPHGRWWAKRWKWKKVMFRMQVVVRRRGEERQVTSELSRKNDVSGWSRWKIGANFFSKCNWEAWYQFLFVHKMMNIKLIKRNREARKIYRSQVPGSNSNDRNNEKLKREAVYWFCCRK